MRRVASEDELDGAFARASAEARAFFSDGAVYAEKLIEGPRHIEVQVVADTRGNAVAVGERECSLQRRHQKVLEECPSPAVGPELRTRLFAAALAAARAVDYVSCGTVEFLLSPDGSFYFLEMNTRLQVEHPVTEEVFGVDLAAEMIRIALGRPLSFGAADLTARGHAIECRIYAEDPRRDFAPSPGTIAALRLPAGPGVRHDLGVEQGSTVPFEYDPMLGKLIVSGADRPRAIARLSRALAEYEISGIETTLPLFRKLMEEPDFVSGAVDVQWLERRLADGLLGTPPPAGDDVVLAAVSLSDAPPDRAVARAAPASHWRAAARAETLRR
jgi:acetyl/propionyl-CoA carboxylase alpha subunit